MKKIILLVACAAMAGAASAQGFSYGIKAGANAANLTDINDSKMKFDFYAGAFAEYTFNPFIGLQVEAMYSGQGVKYDDLTLVTDRRTNLSYLNVPVLAKIYLLESLSLDLGPQFGFLLGAKYKFDLNGNSESADVKDDLKTFDISVPMGLTYHFPIGLEVNARYVLGLTKVNDTGDVNSKNGVIQLGLGYRF